MDTPTTSDVAHQLVAFCRAGKFIKAQTELMADDCEQIEPAHANAPSSYGLLAILEKEKRMQATVVEMHTITVSEPIVAGAFFSVSMEFDLTSKNHGRVKLEELATYQVRNGKIVREQFFY